MENARGRKEEKKTATNEMKKRTKGEKATDKENVRYGKEGMEEDRQLTKNEE